MTMGRRGVPTSGQPHYESAVLPVTLLLVVSTILVLPLTTGPAVAMIALTPIALYFLVHIPRRDLESRSDQSDWDRPRVGATVLFMALPSAVATMNFTGSLGRLLLLGLTCALVVASRSNLQAPRSPYILLALHLVNIVILAREPLTFGLVLPALCATVTCFVLLSARPAVIGTYIQALFAGFACLIILNAVARLGLGITAPGDIFAFAHDAPSSSGTFFSGRLRFPFTSGLNSGAAIPSAYVAAVLASRDIRWSLANLFHLTALAAGTVMLFGTNSRTALAAAVTSGLAFRFLRALAFRLAGVIGVLALALPLWWSTFIASFSPVLRVLDQVSYFNRGGGTDLETLQNRTLIWRDALHAFLQGPSETQLYGFGGLGQVRSGASTLYGTYLEGGLVDARLASAHNSLMQQLLNGGVISAAMLVVVVWLALRNVGASHALPALEAHVRVAVCAGLLALVATGATEAHLATSTFPDTYFVFQLLLASAFALHSSGRGPATLEPITPVEDHAQGDARRLAPVM